MVKPSYSTFQTIGRRSTVFSTKGVVCSSQPLASEAGLTILKAGGNAAEAAVAMAAALNVVEPCNCGIGGDLFALYYDASTKAVKAVNGSGRSPKALTLKKARELGIEGTKIPLHNVNAATVPGALAGLVDIQETFGSGQVSLAEVFQPAITLAEDGYAVHPQAAYEWSTCEQILKAACDDPSYPFLIDGETPNPGEFISNPALGRTLRTVIKEGKDGFYRGRVAQAIVDAVNKRGGVMTLEDLAEHTTDFVEPISYTYGEERLTIHECPPNGQGLAALIAIGIIDVLREDGVIKLDDLVEGSVEWLHLLIEAMRLAFADAHSYIADLNFSNVPVDVMLSKEYLRERAKLFSPTKAEAQYKQGRPLPSGDTVYFTAADKDGNAISMIMSNYLGFGTAVVPLGCGFSLQSRGGGFVLEEGAPNVLDGGKRPFHTIIPAMVTRGDELYMSYGVMGGAMQPQGHLQVLIPPLAHRNILRSHHPQSALDVKRFCIGSTSWHLSSPTGKAFFNSTIALEHGIPEDVVEGLRGMGHDVEVIKGHAQVVFGKGQIIMRTIDERTGKRIWAAGSDPRGDGCALPQI